MKRALVLSMALALPLAACGGPAPIQMLTAPQTPAAQGTVVARPAENGNVRLTVEVKHLAPPERVSPTAKVYVVWVQPQSGPPQTVGAVRVDQTLTGRRATITVHQTTDPRSPQVVHRNACGSMPRTRTATSGRRGS